VCISDETPKFQDFACLAKYRSEISRYAGQKGTMVNSPAMIAATFGKGHVILISPHPESSEELRPIIQRAILAAARLETDENQLPP
jgi:glutamine amidotransferase-like uncharacterized protein